MSVLVIDIPKRAAVSLWLNVSGFVTALFRGFVGLFRLSIRQYVMVLMAVLLVSASAMQIPAIDRARDNLRGVTIVGDAVESAPPPEIVLLTHALGGFKVILIDLVWMRAVKMLNSKQFWELAQLYDWMGKLEPRLEEVWVFNGWNMSYNIVAELSDSESRWQWIDRAIAWLRDEGLRYNPKSGEIKREMAWIFWNKIGAYNDNHNAYYKHRWALIMNAVIGEEQHDWDFVDKLPTKLGEVLTLAGMEDKYMDVADSEERQKKIEEVLALRREMEKFIDRYSDHLGVGGRRSTRFAAVRKQLLPLTEATVYRQLPAPLREFLDQPENKEAKQILREFMMARVLRKDHKMDIGLMHDIEYDYGYEKTPESPAVSDESEEPVMGPERSAPEPVHVLWKMDWRLPDPHAIYWARRSLESQTERLMSLSEQETEIRKKYDRERVHPERLIFYSLKQLYRRGQIAYMDPIPTGNINMTYDLDSIEALHQYYIRRIAEMQKDQDRLDTIWRALKKAGIRAIPEDVVGLSTAKDGHIYFLQEVSEMLYYSAQMSEAAKYFKYGQDVYDKFKAPDNTPYSIEEYCLGKIKKLLEESGTRAQVRGLIEGMILRFYFLYSCYQDQEAAGWIAKAEDWWHYYVKDAILRDQGKLEVERHGLPTFKQLKQLVLRAVLRGERPFPGYLKGRLVARLDLSPDWLEKVDKALGERGTHEEEMRKKALEEASSPLPGEKQKTIVEEEEERRRQEQERREREEAHDREIRMRRRYE